ncbi:hypothetical protein N665_0139s0042 [Sinapis alba]|nr:hypothetical protein N665_0139s0042 [Sinapis alba]
MCDHCNMTRAIVHCETHLAMFCFHCDCTLHYVTVDSPHHSRFLLCNNCVSQTAAVHCHDQRLSLSQTCFSNANDSSRILLCNNDSGYSFSPLFDLDSSSSSSSSSSFIDLDWGYSPFVPLPLSYRDSSSSFGTFQNFDNYTKNSIDHQVQKLHPDYLDIPKDSSCLGFDCYETKEIENICLNHFDDYKTLFDLQECFTADELILTDQLIDRITKHNADTKTEVIPSLSSVTHQDYNTEALANASCEDYKKNQMISSKANEEINNNAEIFSNGLIQLDCEPSRAYDPQARLEALKRYFAKKEKRKFGKQIRYESRKSTADTKRRLKGRFTKAGAAYDYDPRANNTDKETNKFMT